MTELEEASALAALGFLTPRSGTAHEVSQMAQAAALIAETVPPVPPAPALRDRLMGRVAAWEAIRPLADVRNSDGGWVNAGIPGLDTRPLFHDASTGRTTMLVRMEPGVRLPSHRHHDDEQCLVLKGDIRWGDVVYEEGDFVVMGKGTTHPTIHSVHGNLLLIIAGHNEFVHA